MDEAMNTAPAIPAIYGAILGVMSDIGAIGKDSKNEQQDFMYRSIEAIMNAMHPVMIKNGMFPVPNVLELKREERVTSRGGSLAHTILTVRYDFIAVKDGSRVSATVAGEGMDSGDKATNKAMSAAFKYACSQVFCIPTEDKDGDAETPEPSRRVADVLEEAKSEAASLGIDPVKMSNYYKVPVDQLGLREYNDAIRMKRERDGK